jgi:hypothetical protein
LAASSNPSTVLYILISCAPIHARTVICLKPRSLKGSTTSPYEREHPAGEYTDNQRLGSKHGHAHIDALQPSRLQSSHVRSSTAALRSYVLKGAGDFPNGRLVARKMHCTFGGEMRKRDCAPSPPAYESFRPAVRTQLIGVILVCSYGAWRPCNTEIRSIRSDRHGRLMRRLLQELPDLTTVSATKVDQQRLASALAHPSRHEWAAVRTSCVGTSPRRRTRETEKY